MFASEMKEPAKVVIKSNILDKKVPATPSRRSEEVASTPQAKTAHSVVRPASEAAPAASGAGAELPPGFDPQGILEDIRKLKLIVKAHERRIKTLEERVAQYEAPSTDEDGLGETC